LDKEIPHEPTIGNPNSTFVDTPEDAKSELQLQNLFVDYYLDAQDYHDEFFKTMEEAEGIYEGDKTAHWGKNKATGKAVWEEVEATGRPALVKNKVFPLINLLCGIQSQEPIESRFIGRSTEDMPVADATSEVIKWIGSRGKYEDKTSMQFMRGAISGRGWLGIEQIDSEKEIFGTTTLITVLDTGEVLYDRKSREFDLSDADYLIRVKTITRSEVRNNWPDKEKDLTAYFGFLDNDISKRNAPESRLSTMRRNVQIGELWYRVYKEVNIVVDSFNGGVHFVDDIPQEKIAEITQANPHLRVIKKHVKTMKLIRQCGLSSRGVLLDYGDSPYEDNLFPYVPFFGYRGRNHDFGVVKNLIDPQREINKRDSQILHMINTTPKTRIITDDSDLADRFEQGQDVVVTAKGAKFQLVPPPQFPEAHARMVESNKHDIKDISGINDNLQGNKSNSNEPGIVVSLRQKQGMTMVASLLKNLQASVELGSKLMLSRMRQFMKPEQIARILGEDTLKKYPGIVEMVLSKESEDFDIEVIQVPSSPTVRAENFVKLTQLMNLKIPIPPDVVIDASDVPQKEQIKQAMSAVPQMTGQPGAPPLPGANSGGSPLPGQSLPGQPPVKAGG